MAPLLDLLKSKRVLICCGPGGVGKTTTSAVLGLQGALQGLKTIVLTIDPAKRLANSLGIEKIDFKEREIPAQAFKALKQKPKAPLYAMMLDTKHTFDQIILKYSANKEKAQTILNNQLYQNLSNMIAGSQEYMAMEKLHEVMSEGHYDLIVLDTPPSRHALEFLEAPQKMSAMVGDSIMKWFLKPSLFVSKTSLNFIDKSMRRVFKSLDKVAGFEFLQDLSMMLITTSGLLEGFRERADQVQELLRDDKTSFLLISSPQAIPLQEAEFFFEKIQEYQLPFAGFIFNRVYELTEKLDTKVDKKLKQKIDKSALDAYQSIETLYKKLSDRDAKELKKFRAEMKLKNSDYLFQTIPQLDHDVHDLAGLDEIGRVLVS